MKPKELNELKELSADELNKKAGALNRELLSARIARVNQQLKNPLKLRELRRDIARVKTALKAKGVK
ncbi:MAG: 50S ribosomal protein L29 [Candidatus Margulisbacteria bacterium]|nr:50S ribosomal protein L29 [Candidatus Margulisiibacteriota bacterium]